MEKDGESANVEEEDDAIELWGDERNSGSRWIFPNPAGVESPHRWISWSLVF